jgi:hypothetical protein
MNEQVEHGIGQTPTEQKSYSARVDHEVFHLSKPDPTGTELLALVHKKPCAYELIEVFHDDDQTNIVLPDEKVDLRKRGLKGYLSAHREIVDIYLMSDKPLSIQRGTYSVAQILEKAGVSPETHMLLQELDGQPPLPVPPTEKLNIKGCEVFYVQPQTGGSS